jgi:hypothetical protein
LTPEPSEDWVRPGSFPGSRRPILRSSPIGRKWDGEREKASKRRGWKRRQEGQQEQLKNDSGDADQWPSLSLNLGPFALTAILSSTEGERPLPMRPLAFLERLPGVQGSPAYLCFGQTLSVGALGHKIFSSS